MSYDDKLALINSWIATLGAIGGWVFVILYGVGATWWRHAESGRANITGRVIMLLMTCLTLLLTAIVVVRWRGDYPFRREVNTALFLLLVCSVYGLLGLLFKYQMLDRWRQRKDDDDARPDDRPDDRGPVRERKRRTRRPR